MITDKPHIIIIKHPSIKLNNLQKLHYAAIPPLNTDVSFGLSEYKDRGGKIPVLPTYFDWSTVLQDDTPSIKRKKKLIYPIVNQELCGSCYAMSTATSISDSLVISGITDYFPDISTTYALSCYDQGGCNGGNPGSLLQDIAKTGISTNKCIDYSWCDKNSECNGGNTLFQNTDLNLLIPKCNCKITPTSPLYFVEKNPVVISITVDLPRERYFQVVKNHIMNVGPLIAGFFVEKNFLSGRFAKMNNGIYLENGIYDKEELQFKNKTYTDYFYGGHTVEVIGWGVGKNTIINNKGDVADVPYWICKNTWGKDWGDNGYFKMAVYPYNQVVQFDVMIEDKIGGMILFKPSKKILNDKSIENYTNKPKNDTKVYIVLLLFILFIIFTSARLKFSR